MKNTTDPRLAKLCEALEMRSARPNTRATYLRCAAKFLDVVGKPIKQVTRDHVEQFLLAQTRDGRAPRTRNIYLASIRWLLRAAGRRDVTALLRQARVSKALGTVLSGSDVEKLLTAITSLKQAPVVQQLLGHADLATTQRYADMVASDRKAAIALFDAVPDMNGG